MFFIVNTKKVCNLFCTEYIEQFEILLKLNIKSKIINFEISEMKILVLLFPW